MFNRKTAMLVGALAISGVASADLNTGLKAYYCFDDASNLGKDCSSNGNNGTAEGQVTADVGLVGGAASFGGYHNPGDIHVPNSPSLQFSSDATIAFAISLTGFDGLDGNGNYVANGWHSAFAKSHDHNGFAIISRETPDTQQLASGAIWHGNENSIFVTTKKYQIGQWRHFVYVFSNKNHTAKIYADGVLVNTEAFDQSFDTANARDLYLGKYSDYWYALNGKLDEMRIYNRALSATEISALYKLTKPLGGTLQGFNSYSTTCTNTTTGKKVTIATSVNPIFNCEKAGLAVNPKDNVTLTIKGNAH